MSDDFEFGLIPERRMDWRTLAASYGLQVVFILFLIVAGLLWPEKMPLRRKYTVTELVPRPVLRVKHHVTREPQKKLIVAKLLPPVRFESPRLVVPKDLIRKKKKKELEKEIEAPKFEARNEMPQLPRISGALPARLVYTGSFGSSAIPTLNAPSQKVQTGGFGDPNGLKAQGKDASGLTAKLGGFDLPEGQGVGNGSGGTHGTKGTIASAGFGDGIAQPGRGDGRTGGRGAPQIAGFAAQEVATAAKPRLSDTALKTSPVEILYKPNPAYTQEARQLKLQGEVLLEVMFGANGQLHVNRVVRGLGHGLDETATAAADKIKFKPAEHNGSAVDSTAVVHVTFQLAM
ncbi:MAG: energy transducer TonB [Acidobacteriota bacterium]|jgi:TonB family protein|nr:energy transducer TonB [Acidobacteriota bacterium]